MSLSHRNSQNKKKDILTVTATADVPLTGAPVTLWKKVNGLFVQVGGKDKVLNSDGVASFTVRDTNRNRKILQGHGGRDRRLARGPVAGHQAPLIGR